MRRSIGFVLGTLAGTSLLVGAKLGTHTAGATRDTATAVTVTGGGAVAGGSPAPSTPSAPHGRTPSNGAEPTGPSTPPRGSSPPGSAPSPTARPTTKTTTGAPKPTPTPSPSGPRNGTYNASAAVRGGRYGTLAMTVTIAGNKLTSVAASESNPTESNCYNSACPRLTSEALTAQSANISAVSGATYTSEAYRSALAAVLSTAKG